MNPFVYQFQEVQCDCFNNKEQSNNSGLKPNRYYSNSLHPLVFRRITKSSESKIQRQQNNIIKTSLRHQKPKTPNHSLNNNKNHTKAADNLNLMGQKNIKVELYEQKVVPKPAITNFSYPVQYATTKNQPLPIPVYQANNQQQKRINIPRNQIVKQNYQLFDGNHNQIADKPVSKPHSPIKTNKLFFDSMTTPLIHNQYQHNYQINNLNANSINYNTNVNRIQNVAVHGQKNTTAQFFNFNNKMDNNYRSQKHNQNRNHPIGQIGQQTNPFSHQMQHHKQQHQPQHQNLQQSNQPQSHNRHQQNHHQHHNYHNHQHQHQHQPHNQHQLHQHNQQQQHQIHHQQPFQPQNSHVHHAHHHSVYNLSHNNKIHQKPPDNFQQSLTPQNALPLQSQSFSFKSSGYNIKKTSLRGSNFQKQQIPNKPIYQAPSIKTSRVEPVRIMLKQIESIPDENDHFDDVSEVIGKGWESQRQNQFGRIIGSPHNSDQQFNKQDRLRTQTHYTGSVIKNSHIIYENFDNYIRR